MSRRANAPYNDHIGDEGRTLIYEGHDIGAVPGGPDPKTVDQPLVRPDGRPTDNAKFFEAAKRATRGEEPEVVRVYEKLKTNIWVFNGTFQLVDAWQESDGTRKVCKFKLRLLDEQAAVAAEATKLEHTRIIPSAVKYEVWKRDEGKCVMCGSVENLHFDHEIPFSRGGTSLLAANIRLLCAKHNLAKGNKIE